MGKISQRRVGVHWTLKDRMKRVFQIGSWWQRGRFRREGKGKF